MDLSSNSPQRAEPNDAAPLLQLRSVGKRYRNRRAIHVKSLDVFDGDSLRIVGDNGSGKSTLLRILAGVTRPSYGRAIRSPQARAMHIVMAPQYGGLYPALTLTENIDAIGRLFGRPSPTDDRAIPGLYELGLNEFVDRRVGELSGGYQRLAAIAVALAIAPSGLLVDEPFAALDPEKAQRLGGFLRDAKQNLRFLVVTGHADDGLSEGFGRTVSIIDGNLQP